MSLPPEKRDRFKAISERITELAQEFSKNIRENKTVAHVHARGVRRVCRSRTSTACRAMSSGNIVVGFDYPDYVPFMSNASNDEARKRYYVANMNRGTDAQSGDPRRDRGAAERDRRSVRRAELRALRHEAADGREPGDRDALSRRGEERRHRGGAERSAAARGVEGGADRRAGRAGARSSAGTSSTTASGCASSATPSTRKRCASTSRRCRRCTGCSTSPSGSTASRFSAATVPVWHEDVMYYDVDDAATGERIGGIYLDLYPRADKYKHAAAWPVRGVSRKAGRKPISVLVTNFDRVGLTHSELETLLHEFGHVMHGVLSQTEYNQHSGTSVERDFVEAPSQMYEEWASRMESLALMRDHCTTCPIDRRVARAAHPRGEEIRIGHRLRPPACCTPASTWRCPASSRGSRSMLWREMEGCDADGLRRRHRLPRHVRAHRQRLRGRATTATCGRR